MGPLEPQSIASELFRSSFVLSIDQRTAVAIFAIATGAPGPRGPGAPRGFFISWGPRGPRNAPPGGRWGLFGPLSGIWAKDGPRDEIG